MFMPNRLGIVICQLALYGSALGADDVDALFQKARAALAQGQVEGALALANKAVAADPQSAKAYFIRGLAYEALRKHKEAITDFDKTIQLEPKAAEAYNRRGSEHFILGNITGSLADFDKFLTLRPEDRPGHWKRGITCYYAGRFDDGRKQFGVYEQVDTNDVENAVWHLMCAARVDGIEKARKSLLKIGKDRRVPLMEVYALFAGKLKPEDVLAAAEAGNPPAEQLKSRQFYAHFYLGLYYDMLGDKKRTLEHLTKAEETEAGGYMWEVARVHRRLLRQENK